MSVKNRLSIAGNYLPDESEYRQAPQICDLSFAGDPEADGKAADVAFYDGLQLFVLYLTRIRETGVRLMLVIYGRETLFNVRKVLWLCDELGIEYRREEMTENLTAGRNLPLLSADPDAMAPVIRDDDFVLRESNTILRYLANSRQADFLYPADPQRRARTDQWMDWQATELNTSWRYAFTALVRGSPGHQDPRLLAAACQGWNYTMEILNRQLESTGEYVAGSLFSLADIPVGLAVNRWYETPLERPDCPAIRRYYQRLSERQGYVRWGRNGLP